VLATTLAGFAGATSALAEARATVVLDPGHGGTYPGAVNCHFRFAGRSCMRESDLNLDIAIKAARFLRGKGFHVVMTRNSDSDVNASHTEIATHNRTHDDSYVFNKDGVYDIKDELQARVNKANCSTLFACAPGDPRQADAFLSIHINACTCSARGTTTLHTHAPRLATFVQREVVKHVGLPNRGVERADLYVTRWTRMPAALLEAAFMSNDHEARLLKKASFRRKIAKGIAAGIAAFFKP
jgi:N-acetylmuramoyl-L-alanine amidase